MVDRYVPFSQIEQTVIDKLAREEERERILKIVELSINEAIREKVEWHMAHNAAKIPEEEKDLLRKKIAKKYQVILTGRFVHDLTGEQIADKLYTAGLVDKRISKQRVSQILNSLKNKIIEKIKAHLISDLQPPLNPLNPHQPLNSVILDVVKKYLTLTEKEKGDVN